jgi:NAD(P)-dependent dehydrogenase (short-subunit alcohol dehydrogenase family)
MDIYMRGTFHIMRAIFPHLKKPGASAIIISAPQSLIPMIGQIHVCVAKTGVDMITRTLALEWVSSGARVNSIVPGPIGGTEGMNRFAQTEDARQKIIRSLLPGRMVTKDIGKACLFLCSDGAS